jgi:hypothetical protein
MLLLKYRKTFSESEFIPTKSYFFNPLEKLSLEKSSSNVFMLLIKTLDNQWFSSKMISK